MVSYLTTILFVFTLSGSLSGILIQAEPLQGNNVTKVVKGKYSYVVSIAHRTDAYYEEYVHICTGVLITKKFVLTAAHCFENMLLGEIRLIVGSVNLRKGKKYDPSMWITYDQWAESKNITKKYKLNDIAMIKLSDKVSRLVAIPASLSYKNNSELYDKDVALVGWGRTREITNHSSRYLQKANVKVYTNTECYNIVHNITNRTMTISNNLLCTKGVPHALLASGDSGGPVFRKNSLVAISRSVCPDKIYCNLPVEAIIDDHRFNLHTSINFYRDFMADVMKESY